MIEKYISTPQGIQLYAESYGKIGNEACLFISGAGANSSFWREELCDALVKKISL